MFLTQSGGFIIKPISRLLGAILSLLYRGLNAIGVESIGIAIILFTLIVRLIIFPLMYKQNRSSKIMSMIQPEINKATKKYRGKTDQQSMMEVQRITKEIQSKYGVSMTSGCLTSLIQLPIFLALYRVIQNIPAYVPKVYDMYKPIATAIQGDSAAQKALEAVTADGGQQLTNAMKSINYENTNTIIDVLANFPRTLWDTFAQKLGNSGAVVDAMTANGNVDNINFMLPMFWLGYFCQKEQEVIDRHRCRLLIASLVAFAALLPFWSGRLTVYMVPIQVVDWTNGTVDWTNLNITVYRMVIGIVGSMVFFLSASWVYGKIEHGRLTPTLNNLGKCTLGIYWTQTFLLECTLHGLGFYVGTAGSFIVGPVVATIELILCYQVVLLLKKHRYTRLLLLGEK